MALDAPHLAALFAKDDLRVVALVDEVAYAHLNDGADAAPREHGDAEEEGIAIAEPVIGGDGVEEPTAVLTLECRCLPLLDDELRCEHGLRGVESEHAALRQPLEPVAKRGELELDARDAQLRLEALEVCCDRGRRDAAQLDVLRSHRAPRTETNDSATVRLARVAVRNARREELERRASRVVAGVGDQRRHRHLDARRTLTSPPTGMATWSIRSASAPAPLRTASAVFPDMTSFSSRKRSGRTTLRHSGRSAMPGSAWCTLKTGTIGYAGVTRGRRRRR